MTAILDNVLAHWVLSFHRAMPGPGALTVEWLTMTLGAVFLD